MITRKKYIINEPRTIYGFITSDGYEFASEHEAIMHEDSLIPIRKIEKYYLSLNTLDEGGACCYKITEEADLEYLQAKEWNHNGLYEYNGPGWYLTIRHDGGDYNETYEVIKVDDYKTMLEDDLSNIKYLTNS
jgi:hypothetical protein